MIEYMPFIQGLLIGFSLIIAIGAQNAFVIKQGILRNNVFIIALTCSMLDAILIFIGVMGFDYIISPKDSVAFTFVIVAGIIFLLSYGARSFYLAFRKTEDIMYIGSGSEKIGPVRAFLTVLALTLLNPHAYLDTCVLIGSVGVRFSGEDKTLFAAGAICASIIWFFSLGYAARLLLPIFQKPISWKILDFAIGIMMLLIAMSLVVFLL
jgi:L-lysine exporter family protein LysE/ArgO